MSKKDIKFQLKVAVDKKNKNKKMEGDNNKKVLDIVRYDIAEAKRCGESFVAYLNDRDCALKTSLNGDLAAFPKSVQEVLFKEDGVNMVFIQEGHETSGFTLTWVKANAGTIPKNFPSGFMMECDGECDGAKCQEKCLTKYTWSDITSYDKATLQIRVWRGDGHVIVTCPTTGQFECIVVLYEQWRNVNK